MHGRAWLVADVGGTNTRVALADPDTGALSNLVQMSTAGAASFRDLLGLYLSELPARQRPTVACVAVAGPVAGDQCRLTNSPLTFSIQQTRQDLVLDELLVTNDFAATARCLPDLTRADYQLIGDPEVREDAVRIAIGPGTGLGVAAVVPVGRRWKVIAGEGGHVTLSAQHEDEMQVLTALRDLRGFVSAEMALSGQGLRRIYATIAEDRGIHGDPPQPGEIVKWGCAGDEVSATTLGLFSRLLAAVAANAALTFGATGGVFIAGGVVRRFPEMLSSSGFRERFVTHPHAGDYLGGIATALITVEQPGLMGAYRMLRDHATSGGAGLALANGVRRL